MAMKTRLLSLICAFCILIGGFGDLLTYAGTQSYTLLASDGNTYRITVTYSGASGIPETAVLKVREITEEETELRDDRGDIVTDDAEKEPTYDDYVGNSAELLGEGTVAFAKVFDIALVDSETGEVYQPNGKVKVKIQLLDGSMADHADVNVVHFHGEIGDETEVLNSKKSGETVEFSTDSFSVFVVLSTILKQKLTASDGKDYLITVTYDDSCGIPQDAELAVSEIKNNDGSYEDYVTSSSERLGRDPEDVLFAHAFDIKLKNPHTGEDYQPTKDVWVSIQLLNESSDDYSKVNVIHYHGKADGNSEVMDVSVNGKSYEFKTNGFSVYVIISHIGDTIKTPRVEFHFIDRYSDEQYQAGVDVTNETTASPYNFVNLSGSYQTTQILKDEETLELIDDPRNITISGKEKYFYGWYVVNASSDTAAVNSESGKYEGAITFKWPDTPDQIKFEKTLSITGGEGANNPLQVGDKVKWTLGDVSGEAELDDAGTAHVYLAPLYEDFYFINFHKGTVDSEEMLKKSLVVRKLVVFGSGTTASVRIGNIMCDSSDPQHKLFSGWQEEISDGNGGYTYITYRTVEHLIDEHGDITNVERNDPSNGTGYYIDVNKATSEVFHLDLYPVFDEARWIYFERGATGNGSTYVGASYRLANDIRSSGDNSAYYYLDSAFFAGSNTSQGHMSKRAGYELEGWYLFADMDVGGDILNMNAASSVTVDIVDIGAKTSSTIDNVSVTTGGTTGGTTVSATSVVVNNDTVISITVPLQATKLVNGNGSFAQANGYTQKVTYTIDGTQKTVTLFAMEDGVLRFYKAMDKMTLFANWVKNDSTTYRVIIWKQKVTDSYTITDTPVDVIEWLAAHPGQRAEDYPNAVKSYDYVTTFVSNSVSTSTTADLVTGFTGNYTWSEEVGNALVTHTVNVSNRNLTQQSVMNALTGFAGEFKGFKYSDTDFIHTALEPDGTTVYNVYYDRITYTLKFYFARTEITGGTTTYTSQGSYGNFSSNMVSTGTYYVKPGNSYYQLDYDSSYGWYYNRNGIQYMSQSPNLIVYTATTTGGTLRWRGTSSTAAVTDYTSSSISWNVTLSGINDVSDFCYYTNVGSTVRGNYTYYYYPITANYGQDISDLWPEYSKFPYAPNGTSGNRVTSIMLMAGAGAITGTGGGSTVKGKLTIMDEQVLGRLDEPDGNFMIIRTGTGKNWRYFIWKEQLKGVDYSTYTYTYTDHDGTTVNVQHNDAVKTRSGVDYYLQEVVLVRSGSSNTGQHAPAYEGFTWDNDASDYSYSSNSTNPYMRYYYTRDTETLTFNVNYPIDAGITYNGETVESGQAQRSSDMMVGVQFDESLQRYGSSTTDGVTNWYYGVPTLDGKITAENALIAPDHYIFGGWYEDEACTVPFNFNSKMPAANKMIYAKWTPETFQVKINPNGGEINRVNQRDGYYYTQLQRLGGVDIPLFQGTYLQFKQYLNASTDHFPGSGNISTGQSTYINANYNETVSEYVIPRRFVAMSESAADEFEADGNSSYYYVNYQLRPTDGAAGVYTHIRSALYLTDEEISHFYQLYKECVTVSLTQYPDDNVGMVLLDEDTWRSVYVSPTRYRPVNSSEHWTFLGWYKTPEGGEEEGMPYNFSDPVAGNFTLTAHWRLDGGYTINYVPQYTMPDGATINGTLPSWLDPADGLMTYADGASTEIYKSPTDLTKTTTQEGTVQIKDDSVIFRGWALVNKKADGTFEPAEKDSSGNITTYYYPSDPYIVNAANAGNDSKVYFQAIYQYKGSSDRQPKITNLTLDANGGYINAGYNSVTPNLPVWNDYPGVSTVNTTDHMITVSGDSVPTQIIFSDVQSNAPIHLYKYATDPGVIKPDGYNYFTSPEGHFLLGFDDSQTEGDYIATYPADAIIANTRNDSKTIYAVWEPMVYLTFKNETDGEITLDLKPADPSDTATLEIINVRNGMYDRKKLGDYSSITLKALGDPDGLDTVALAFPKGAEKDIKISGTNNLGVGKVLMWDSSVTIGSNTYNTRTSTGSTNTAYTHTTQDEHSHTLAAGEADNTRNFSFVESLIVNENPVIVTFTSSSNDYALLFDDNFPAASGLTGSTQELDFPKETVLTIADPEGVKTYSPLPNPNSCPGYQFKGWASAPNATAAEFTGSIDNMQTFFEVDWNPRVNTELINDDKTVRRTLYAVWEEYSDPNTVYIFKTVPAPGRQDQDFAFDVVINAGYKPQKSSSETTFSKTGSFSLRHNQYAKLYTEQHTDSSPVKVTMQIWIYNSMDNSRVDPSLGTGPDVTIEASLAVSKTGGTMSTTDISVNEKTVTYYVASIKRQSQKEGNGINLVGTKTSEDPAPLTVTGTEINWNSIAQRGTVIYTNQRDTYDVTVNKTLVSNVTTAHNFTYKVSYDDAGTVTTLYSANEPLTVVSGSSSVINDIPAGTNLTVEEITDADDDYAIETAAVYTSGANAGSTISDGDGNDKNAAVVVNALEGDVSLNYTNTLKSYKITMKLVDQNGDPLHALFALNSTIGSLGTDLYAGDQGVFYTSNKYWADTYTLNQTTTPGGYLSLQGTPVTLKVTGNGITSSHSWVTVSGNATDGYVVTVKNWKQVNMTVKKVMNDALLTGQKTFSFTYSYKSAVDGETVTGTIDLKPTANNAAGVSQTLKIPIDSTNFKVEETADNTYDTVVTYEGADTPTIVNVTYTGSTPPAVTTPSCAITPIDDNGTLSNKVAHDGNITFTNTRRTVNLTVKKTVKGDDLTGTFEIVTKLLSGGKAIANATVGTDSNSNPLTTDANGEVSFNLSHHGAQSIKIPVGANVTVTEKLTSAQKDGNFQAFMIVPDGSENLVGGESAVYSLYAPSTDTTLYIFNIPCICKVTDGSDKLLYRADDNETPTDTSDDIYIPAIFATIRDAFSYINNEALYVKKSTSQYEAYEQDASVVYPYKVKMLVDYKVPNNDVVEVNAGHILTFTTAEMNAEDGYSFRRTGAYEGGVHEGGVVPTGIPADKSIGKAVLTREKTDSVKQKAFFTVSTAEGNPSSTTFTMSDLIIDGNGATLENNVKGGCLTAYNTKVTIDGCIIYRFEAAEGGAVYTTGDYLTVKDSVFDTCISTIAGDGNGGGAINTTANTLTATNSTFKNCTAVHQAGAIYQVGTNKTMVMTDCHFADCSSRSGGAVQADVTYVTVSGCTFTRCSAVATGNGGNGGGLNNFYQKEDSKSRLTVTNCTFRGCTSTGNGDNLGGGLRSKAKTVIMTGCIFEKDGTTPCGSTKNGGGAAFDNANGNVTVENCTFDGCEAASGGGIYTIGKLTVAGTTLIDQCVAKNNGGAIFVNGGSARVTITGGTISNNTAKGYGGGAIRVDGGAKVTISGDKTLITGNKVDTSNTEKCGGAIGIKQGEVTIQGGTISQNYAIGSGNDATRIVQGGAIFVDGNPNAILRLEGGKIINNCAEATNNNGLAYGGAINVKSGGVIYISGGEISGNYVKAKNNANAKGAGIYLAEGATLNISGSPNFGGTGIKNAETGELDTAVGNLLTVELPANTYNGEAVYEKARQDIYLAGYSGITAESIHVNDKLTGANGTIWVWAEQNPHYVVDQQFAIIDDGKDPGNLLAFRNARENGASYGSTGSNAVLYGQRSSSESTHVIWGPIVSGSRKVILRKVQADANGTPTYIPLSGAVFEIHKGSREGAIVKGSDIFGHDNTTTFTSGSSGVFFIGDLPYGTYYIKETTVPANYKANHDTGTERYNWFVLNVSADGVSNLLVAESGTGG